MRCCDVLIITLRIILHSYQQAPISLLVPRLPLNGDASLQFKKIIFQDDASGILHWG